MAEQNDKKTKHLRSARQWLTRAEESFDKDRDVRGELNLFLAQAELQHAQETSQTRGWLRKYPALRHGLAAIVAVTLAIPNVVLLESFLGFLGFAVKPPLISWGLMLQDTSNYSAIGSYPWILTPVAFVFVTVFAFNALGDGLRDAIDPY